MSDKFKKHVVIFGGCQVLYLEQKKINERTYNGSQLNYDMVVSLANNNPDTKFFVLSGCLSARTNDKVIDRKRIENQELLKSIFKYYSTNKEESNIEFIVENEFRFEKGDTADPKKLKIKLDGLVSALQKTGIDYGVMKGGFFNGHIPFLTPKISKTLGQFDENGNPIMSSKAATCENNIIYSMYVLNNLKGKDGKPLKYITINDDDQFCGLRCKQNINLNVVIPEVANINMYNGFNEYNLYEELDPYVIDETNKGLREFKHYKVPVIFKQGMDTILLKSDSMKSLNKVDIKEKNGLFMYMNFREHDNIRYDRFKDFILLNDLNCDVKLWTNLKDFKNSEIRKNGILNPKQYDISHGIAGHKETMEELCKAKYTLCISVFKTQQCIGRFWEAVYCGVIPFVQRETDENGELIDGIGSKEWKEMYNIPDFLFVKNGKELAEKIEILENNNSLYEETLKNITSLLKDEYIDKNQINKIIQEVVEEYVNKGES